MNDTYKAAEAFLSAEQLNLAARNIQHYLKIQDEQVTLDAIVSALRETLTETRDGTSESLGDMLALQAKILDATFGFYMHNAHDAYNVDGKINMALKAQRQTISTINALQRMDRQTIKKTAERTRQHDQMD